MATPANDRTGAEAPMPAMQNVANNHGDAITTPTENRPLSQRRGRRRRPLLTVVACVMQGADARTLMLRGQTARSLVALVEAGGKGRTALEVSSWALRFAAYCHTLRHDYGLTIITEHEDHDGGWHGRHVLLDRVTILEVKGG